MNLLGGTVPPESIYPLARSQTSSLPMCSAANSPRWANSSTSSWMDVTERRGKQVAEYLGEETIEASFFC